MVKRSLEKICAEAYKLGQIASRTSLSSSKGQDIKWVLEGLKFEAGKNWKQAGKCFSEGVRHPKKTRK